MRVVCAPHVHMCIQWVPWCVHGVCMVCAWCVHGMCMVCAWCGCSVHAWVPRCVHGMCMACAWQVHGMCVCMHGRHGVCTMHCPPLGTPSIRHTTPGSQGLPGPCPTGLTPCRPLP